uniref:AMP-binding enzyme n=1 Tax=Endozoicomonas sp. SESOKO2 TaxID=2828743 RepID=UPI002148D45B
AWQWYHHSAGEERCPIIDSWWQTETGAMMITPLPGATALKPGYATRPFLGIRPAILDNEGNEIVGPGQGSLVITGSWPGQIRTIYGNHQRTLDTYFSRYPGYYFTGDGARRDENGYYQITGRMDDVINVAGHRLGTAEIESALVLHEAIAEAAVVGVPHPVKGESLYAFMTPMDGVEITDDLKLELSNLVASEIGSFARPEILHPCPALPKTRSGKIMRRILRKLAQGEKDDLGDLSTLADPAVIEQLLSST